MKFTDLFKPYWVANGGIRKVSFYQKLCWFCTDLRRSLDTTKIAIFALGLLVGIVGSALSDTAIEDAKNEPVAIIKYDIIDEFSDAGIVVVKIGDIGHLCMLNINVDAEILDAKIQYFDAQLPCIIQQALLEDNENPIVAEAK